MARPEQVAKAVLAMRSACSIPVTVKHRIGIDDLDRYEDMLNFVRIVSEAGCDRFTIHARKAWLSGLSPKENRNVPPLRYEDVHRLKAELPQLHIEINGGFSDWETVTEQLTKVDGVMIRRAAYERPWLFASVDQHFFRTPSTSLTRREVVEQMVAYAERELRTHPRVRLGHIARHMQNLFNGQPGARAWRRRIAEGAFKSGAEPRLLLEAIPAPAPPLPSPLEAAPAD